MHWAGLLRRRAGARAGVLVVLGVLVATIAGVSGTALVAAADSATSAARAVLGTPDGGGRLLVRTRLHVAAEAQQQAFDTALRDRFGDAPLQVDRALVQPPGETTTDDPPFVEWTVRPVVHAVAVDDLPAFVAGSTGLEPALTRVAGLPVRGLEVEGALGESAAQAARAAATVRATGLVPVVLLAVVAVVALVQVAGLLVRDRTGETGVLLARGGGPARLVRWAGAEAAVVAGAGALVGGLVAAAVAGAGAAATPLIGAAALVTALVAVTVSVGTTARQVRALARVDPRPGRVALRTAATLGVAVGAPVVAALTAWRLLRADGLATDGTGTDPLAVAAPAAVLVALALAGYALLGPVGRVGEVLTARRRTLPPALVARQVARRSGEHAVAVVLLVLAVGAVTVAAGYDASVTRHRVDLALLDAGSDVRVALPAAASARGAAATASSSAPFGELDGVAAAVAVAREQVVLGDRTVALTALPVARADDVVRAPVQVRPRPGGPGQPDRSAQAGLSRAPGPDARPVLPVGSDTLEVTLRVSTTPTPDGDGTALAAGSGTGTIGTADDGAVAPVDVAAWLADPDGGLSRVHLGSAAAGGTGSDPATTTLAGALPGAGPYRLAALDVATRAGAGARLESEVTDLATSSGGTDAGPLPLPETAWVLADGPTSGVAEVSPVGPLGVVASATGPPAGQGRAPVLARLLPPAEDGVPVLVSAALAERAALDTGDAVRVALAGPEVALRVVGPVDAVPGSLAPEALLADLDTLGHHLLHTRRTPVLPNEVWVALSAPTDEAAAARVAGAARELAGPGGSAVAASTGAAGTAGSVVRGFWTAAVAAVLLALAGVAAVAVALVRSRRGEVVVLRAVGQDPAAQARARAAEHTGVALLAVVVGALAGTVTTLGLVPALVSSSVTAPGPLPVTPALDVAGAAGLLLCLLAGLAVVAGAVAARVRAQALDRTYRPEVR